MIGSIGLLSLNTNAQEQQVSSLISDFGLGVKFSESTTAQRAQGDLSVVGNNNTEFISIANPALLGELQYTSFSISGHGLNASVQTPDADFNTSSLALTDLSLGFPLGKKGGFALGLRANSVIGYQVESESFFNNANGSVNHIYLGAGYELIRGLSLGAQFNQYFGKVDKLRADKSVQQSRVYNYNYNVNGSSLKLGLQYRQVLKNKWEARVGAYSILDYKTSASGLFESYLSVDNDNNFVQIEDTVVSNQIEGVETNPMTTVLGLGIGESQKWFLGASYQFQEAISYTGDLFDETLQVNSGDQVTSLSYESNSKFILGGYMIPRKNDLKNYLNKMVYRGGFEYENTGIVLNGASVKNIGMSFGIGLPVGKRISYANISLEIGRLGDFDDNKYQENYLNVGVNFSLSDKWFKKRVIN